MPLPRKVFRIELVNQPDEIAMPAEPVPAAAANDADAALRHLEVVTEIRAVRSLIEGRAQEAQRLLEKFQAQIGEMQKLKPEIDMIEDAICRTKQELATIHVTGFNGPEMARVANELDAVVEDTEQATQAILGAVEEIGQNANALAAALSSEADQQSARAIQDKVVRIFEACNFQDLTGQRITKVVATLKFIEDHIQRMLAIWGGIEALKEFTPVARAEREIDDLLHGPKLPGDEGHASQDDIDALFD
jgi:chemotaxis protein CheZ